MFIRRPTAPRRLLRFAVCLLAVLPAAVQAFVCPALTRVGLSDLGYSSYRDGARFRGTSVAVAEELARRTGCRIRLDWYPRGRLFAEYGAGNVDLVMASLRSPERERGGRFIPYSYTRFDLLLTKRSGGNYSSLADFVEHGKARLNLTRGVFYPVEVRHLLDRLQRAGRLEYVNDYDVVFKKIVAGRADGTFAPPIIHLRHQRTLGLVDSMQAFAVSETPPRLVGVFVARASVAREVRDAYADALYQMVADGTVQKIYEREIGVEAGRQVFQNGVAEILATIRRPERP
ncbi:substrate-binding periplasmic protein [Rugamonas sp. CCM 8940]|uniref:substrate-binding periplasmic protein n=1 Tax=Rugamonas sp. CCM 8940 TaxID=2765359 RepID=UPI0018F33DD2|nr:transporter substrate-binding domain-containing protein [Rugamonas sp. CCM 8940]MBJ7309807.1 transporter substrate-binding domain-containing protein [Rugamonas sp. CCM 8940]